MREIASIDDTNTESYNDDVFSFSQHSQNQLPHHFKFDPGNAAGIHNRSFLSKHKTHLKSSPKARKSTVTRQQISLKIKPNAQSIGQNISDGDARQLINQNYQEQRSS